MHNSWKEISNLPLDKSGLIITESEQNEVRNYVLHKELNRPKFALFKLILFLLFQHIIIGITQFLIWYFTNSFSLKLSLSIVTVFIILYLSIRPVFYLSIKCYQRYAKEERRRKCLCKPTCSEYSLICLKKYPTIKALRKIFRRLFITCDGGVYKIDSP